MPIPSALAQARAGTSVFLTALAVPKMRSFTFTSSELVTSVCLLMGTAFFGICALLQINDCQNPVGWFMLYASGACTCILTLLDRLWVLNPASLWPRYVLLSATAAIIVWACFMLAQSLLWPSSASCPGESMQHEQLYEALGSGLVAVAATILLIENTCQLCAHRHALQSYPAVRETSDSATPRIGDIVVGQVVSEISPSCA